MAEEQENLDTSTKKHFIPLCLSSGICCLITITYPAEQVLKRSGFLWFGKAKIEPMSLLTVPAERYRFQASKSRQREQRDQRKEPGHMLFAPLAPSR